MSKVCNKLHHARDEPHAARNRYLLFGKREGESHMQDEKRTGITKKQKIYRCVVGAIAVICIVGTFIIKFC